VIEQLKPLLEEGDMIIDGGNSLYEDTERRTRDLESTTKLGFVGMGVSGGEEGALHGSFPDAGGYRVRLSGIRADFNQNCRPSR
jgi:6-phosphogluconate dehydrogenase